MRMKRMITVGMIVAAALTAWGCSANDPGNASAGRMSVGNLLAPAQGLPAKPDSMPGHNPPPHPPKKQPLSLQFAGADSGFAGQSANTRWLFGNSGHQSISVAWSLTDGNGWAGFPKQGTLSLAPLSSQVLTVAVVVPDTVQVGPNPLHMIATPPSGVAVTADGAIQVLTGSPPPDSMVTRLR
jgi:hypothetical protein